MLKYLRLLFISKIWAALFLGIRVGSGLLVQKIVALNFGPIGTTTLSHLQNFIGLFLQPSQDIAGQGILTAIPKNNWNNKLILKVASIIGLSIFLSVGVLIILYQKSKLEELSFIQENLKFILAAIAFLIIQVICSNSLISLGLIKQLVVLSFIQWTTIISSLLLNLDSLEHLLLAYIISNALFTLVFIAITYHFIRINSIEVPNNSSPIKKHFYQYIIMGLSIWLCSKLSDYGVRAYAILEYNTDQTGYWQAAARISDAYRSLFISFLMITMVPQIAKSEQLKQVTLTFKRHLKPYLGLVILFLSLFIIFHKTILEYLYSPVYRNASSLMLLKLYGDVLALISIPFALVLMAKVETKRYISAELLATVAYISLIILIPVESIEKILYANFLRYAIYLTLLITFTRKYWSSV